MSFNITILTIFPEMFPGPLAHSLAGKALKEGKWSLDTVNIRDFAEDKHGTVDDKPFGGGAGMVMRPDVLSSAIESVNKKKIVYMSPRGELLTQEKTKELLKHQDIAILCGRYEGIDQRIIDEYDIEEVSIGDFVLSGGEIAAFSLIDACVRQISGVLSNANTFEEESFGDGKFANLLEYPLYTRPSEWNGRKVPEVLLSGDHEKINNWRLGEAENITKDRRKDLWQKYLNTAKKA